MDDCSGADGKSTGADPSRYDRYLILLALLPIRRIRLVYSDRKPSETYGRF